MRPPGGSNAVGGLVFFMDFHYHHKSPTWDDRGRGNKLQNTMSGGHVTLLEQLEDALYALGAQ